MVQLEDLQTGTRVTGLCPAGVATVVNTKWIGDQCAEVVYETASGGLEKRLVYRDDEASIELVTAGRPWSFDGDGDTLRLVSEAYRINLAWLFDPYVAITTSLIMPPFFSTKKQPTRQRTRRRQVSKFAPASNFKKLFFAERELRRTGSQ